MINLTQITSAVGVPMAQKKVVSGLTVDTYFLNLCRLSDSLKLSKAYKAITAFYPGAVRVNNCGFSLVVQIPKENRQFYNFENLKPETATGENLGDFFAGYDTENRPIKLNLKQTKSIFIAGSTGGGKSCTMNNIVCSLMLSTPNLTPIFIDVKRVELMRYSNISFMKKRALFAADKPTSEKVLKWAVDKIKNRYEQLQANGKSSADFNELPPIVIFIDEMAQIVSKEQDKIYKLVNFILCVGRAANVFIIGATQIPKSIDNELRSNCPSKIALRCDNIAQSISLIGTADASKLLGYGDALLKIDGIAGLTRVQFANFTDITFNQLFSEYLNK